MNAPAVRPLKFSSILAFFALGSVMFPACLAQSNTGDPADNPKATTAPPVAFVYVSYLSPSDQKGRIAERTAAADGRLTPVAGTPFRADVDDMVVNGKFLFGSTQSGIYIAAFRMGANGALHWTTSTNIARFQSERLLWSESLVLDHTGANLYLEIGLGSLCQANA